MRDEQPFIHPGQLAAIVDYSGETVLRETIIPPAENTSGMAGQMAMHYPAEGRSDDD